MEKNSFLKYVGKGAGFVSINTLFMGLFVYNISDISKSMHPDSNVTTLADYNSLEIAILGGSATISGAIVGSVVGATLWTTEYLLLKYLEKKNYEKHEHKKQNHAKK